MESGKKRLDVQNCSGIKEDYIPNPSGGLSASDVLPSMGSPLPALPKRSVSASVLKKGSQRTYQDDETYKEQTNSRPAPVPPGGGSKSGVFSPWVPITGKSSSEELAPPKEGQPVGGMSVLERQHTQELMRQDVTKNTVQSVNKEAAVAAQTPEPTPPQSREASVEGEQLMFELEVASQEACNSCSRGGGGIKKS